LFIAKTRYFVGDNASLLRVGKMGDAAQCILNIALIYSVCDFITESVSIVAEEFFLNSVIVESQVVTENFLNGVPIM
jgi:hypothetical protein